MPFRDPTRVLILPPGAIPPTVGQSIIVIDPGPPPIIKLYSGDANEKTPGDIRAATSGGIPQLILDGPDTNASIFGRASITEGISQGGAHNEAFIEMIAEDITLRNGSEALTYLKSHSANGGDIAPPVLSYVDIARFKTTSVNMQPAKDVQDGDLLALVNTAYAVGAVVCGFSFTAPPSGSGILTMSCRAQITTTAAVHRIQLFSARVGTGSTLGAGTSQTIEATTGFSDDLALELDNCGFLGVVEGQGSRTFLVQGLTPGTVYNAVTGHRINNATTTTYDVLKRVLYWQPIY
jgi:hypothetical protein